MNKKLWKASEKVKKNSNLFKYENFLARNYKYKIFRRWREKKFFQKY